MVALVEDQIHVVLIQGTLGTSFDLEQVSEFQEHKGAEEVSTSAVSLLPVVGLQP